MGGVRWTGAGDGDGDDWTGVAGDGDGFALGPSGVGRVDLEVVDCYSEESVALVPSQETRCVSCSIELNYAWLVPVSSHRHLQDSQAQVSQIPV